MDTPFIITSAESAEKVSLSISPTFPPSNVYANLTLKSLGRSLWTPLPISSSVVNAILISLWFWSRFDTMKLIAVIIIAIPALSSAPSNVLPDAVIISCPIFSPR